MFKRIEEQSAIANKGSRRPLWIRRIHEFDRLEVHPCKVVGYIDNDPVAIPCEPELASFWTVYGHYCPDALLSGFEAIEDFMTEAEARGYRERIIERYPHLSKAK